MVDAALGGALIALVMLLGGWVFYLSRDAHKGHEKRDDATEAAMAKLEARLKEVEADHVFLKPMADRLREKMLQDAVHEVERK